VNEERTFTMRRTIRIILLSAGAALGYGFGFRAMHDHRDHRQRFEQHIADVCVDAYRRQQQPGAAAPRSTGPAE
jgi:hypothetical protein